jgi:hypothetical protein
MQSRRSFVAALCRALLLMGLLNQDAILAQETAWTDVDGRTMQAEFVRLEGTDVVFRRNGREVSVPISRLSGDDRDRAVEFSLRGPTAGTRSRVDRGSNTAGGRGAGESVERSSPNESSETGPVPNRRRTWTDIRGQQAQARFIEMRDHLVVLKRAGRVGQFNVPFQDLTSADQQFLRELLTSRGEGHLIPTIDETADLTRNSPGGPGMGGTAMYPGMPGANMPHVMPGSGMTPGAMPGSFPPAGGMGNYPNYPGMVDPTTLPEMMPGADMAGMMPPAMPDVYGPVGSSTPPGMNYPATPSGMGNSNGISPDNSSNGYAPLEMGGSGSPAGFPGSSPGSSFGPAPSATAQPYEPVSARTSDWTPPPNPYASQDSPGSIAAPTPRLRFQIDYEKAITLLLFQLFGMAIGSLIAAVILRAVVKWVEGETVEYGTAYVTMLLIGIATTLLRFSTTIGVALGTQSLDAVRMASFGIIPVAILIQVGIISKMLEIEFGRAFLVVLAMLGVGVLASSMVIALPAGILMLAAAAR